MIQEIHAEGVARRYSNGIVTEADVSIIIPALNEEATIQAVVDRCLALPLDVQVIVVNDGSADRTLEILESYGDRITLITNPKPSGKGHAIVQALPFAIGVATIVQDADLEYSPEQIPSLVKPILDGKSHVVFGTRFANGFSKEMAIPNKVVNVMLAWSVRVLFSEKISDEATCYKAFRTSLLKTFDLKCTRFEFCPEVTAKAIRSNQKIYEVPIDYVPRSKEAGKKIRWYDAPEAFWTLMRYRFWKPNLTPISQLPSPEDITQQEAEPQVSASLD
jgi:dolichol-phosphate mannosyltransferase